MRNLIITILVYFSISLSICYGQVDRFSDNQLPKLNIIGIAISEDLESANYVLNEVYGNTIQIEPEFNFYIDPTYKKLKDQKAFDLSIFGKSVSGKKFESNVDTELNLNANSHTMMVLDRKKRVRAFSQVSTIDIDQFSRVVEELLLNLDGEENITVDSEQPETAYGWQTSLGKENQEKDREGAIVIDFGASKAHWYKYIGEEIPDVDLKDRKGMDTSLHQLLGDQVSVVLIIAASKSPDAMVLASGISIQLMYVNGLYHTFVLGEAEPGDEHVENAVYSGN